MFRGFYTLTSDMLTQQRRLNIVSNNMANVATPGFKKDILTTTTFEEALAYRTGSVDKSRPASLGGNVAMMRVPDEKITDYEQGLFDTTGRPFDVALKGPGFFEVETPAGGSVYTRNGSFTLDEEGYLYLQHIGRVLGDDGQPILLRTDKVEFRDDGSIIYDDGTILGKLNIVDFDDYYQLEKTGEGMFTNAGGANIIEAPGYNVMWKMLERSNVNTADEIVAMITSQRGLQSASQILRMYDMIMNKAANDVGRV